MQASTDFNRYILPGRFQYSNYLKVLLAPENAVLQKNTKKIYHANNQGGQMGRHLLR